MKDNSDSLFGNGKSSGNKNKKSKGISWDEETIALHDIERGTRMQIDEPNTPYYYGSSSFSDDEHDQIIKSKIVNPDDLYLKLVEYSNYLGQSESHDAEHTNIDSPKYISKEQLFKEKRKFHYREFIVAKSSQKNFDDDGSDDNDDNNNVNTDNNNGNTDNNNGNTDNNNGNTDNNNGNTDNNNGNYSSNHSGNSDVNNINNNAECKNDNLIYNKISFP